MPFQIDQNYTNFKLWYEEYKKNPLAQASVSFVASCILIILLFAMAIRPTMVTIDHLKDQIEQLEELNNKLSAKSKILQQLLPVYQKLVPINPLLTQAVPDKSNFSIFESQLRFLMVKNKLTINSISFSKFSLVDSTDPLNAAAVQPVKKIDEVITPLPTRNIEVSLSMEGTYQEVKQFIDDAQDLIRITSISQLSLDKIKKTQGQEQQKLSITIKGIIYYQQDEVLANTLS